MFLPDMFRVDDRDWCLNHIAAHGFAQLISTGDGPDDLPWVTPMPMIWDDGVLYGHVARVNQHWRMFDGTRLSQAVFMGDHGYISPMWLPDPARSVPTWNYSLVRAVGAPSVLQDEDRIAWLMDRLSRQYEGPEGWAPKTADPAYMAGMRRGIVAFQMPVIRLEGKAKLSQNKPSDAAARVADRLEEAGGGALAGAMRRALAERPS